MVLLEEASTDTMSSVEARRLSEKPRIHRSYSYKIAEAGYRSERGQQGHYRDATIDIDYVFRSVFGQTEYRGAQREIMKAALQRLDILVLANRLRQISLLSSASLDRAIRSYIGGVPIVGTHARSSDRGRILRDLKAGHPKLRILYISPERLTDRNFLAALRMAYRQQEIVRLVIDEAHVIPSWGDSFRPEYSRLGRFREVFPQVPIMALTASATESTAQEILGSLGMQPQHTWRASHGVDRPNLFYEIRYDRDDRIQRCEAVAEFLHSLPTTERGKRPGGIIYCRSRNTVEELAAYLRGRGFYAAPYHKGLDQNRLSSTADLWQSSQARFDREQPYLDILVATVAFGMGIDCSEVRFVVHWDLPTSFEGYYQETGRAGRDGGEARCLLFYSREDAQRAHGLVSNAREQKTQAEQEGGPGSVASITQLIRLCEAVNSCRHKFICLSICPRFGCYLLIAGQAAYFGDQLEGTAANNRCQGRMCDVCRSPKRTKQLFDDGLTDIELDLAELSVFDGVRAEAARWRYPGSSTIPSVDDIGRTVHQLPAPFDTERPFSVPQTASRYAVATPVPFKPPSRVIRLPGAPAIPPSLDLEAPTPLQCHQSISVPRGSTVKLHMNEPPPSKRQKRDDGCGSPHFDLCGILVEMQPSNYTKPVPLALRKEGVQAVFKHLGRALLSEKGLLGIAQENAIFARFGLANASSESRLNFTIDAALALEENTFWRCQTESGYIDRLTRSKKAAKALSLDTQWATSDAESTDVEQKRVLDVLKGQAHRMDPAL